MNANVHAELVRAGMSDAQATTALSRYAVDIRELSEANWRAVVSNGKHSVWHSAGNEPEAEMRAAKVIVDFVAMEQRS